MKPYSKRHLTEEKRIFNYRLSRARSVSENAFGILAARFGVFHTMMLLSPDKVTEVVLFCCVLHDMFLSKSLLTYCPPGSMDYENENGDVVSGSWREDGSSTISSLRSMPKCKERSAKNVEDMRDMLCYYVNSPGAVPWQWRALVAITATLAAQAYSLLTLMPRNNKQITLQLHLQEHFEELVFTLTCMPIKRNLRFVLKGRILN